MSLLATACSSSPVTAGGGGSTCSPFDLMVAASDERSASELALVSTKGAPASVYGGAELGTDPVLASSNGRVFWIDRGLGHVIELDPRCGTALGPPWSTDDPGRMGATNPQDLAVAPNGELWIARFAVPTVLVKSSDGSADLARIDLSGVAGMNRNPYMSSIRIIDDASGAKAYVSLEMLNEDEIAVDPAYLVRIDVTTRAIDATLQLKGLNPFGLMVEDDSGGDHALYIAAPGSWYAANEPDAGVERVALGPHLETLTSELIVRESDLGASVDQVAVEDGCLVAIVAGPTAENVTSLVSLSTGVVDVAARVVTPLSADFLVTPAGFKLGGLAWLPDHALAVGDATLVSGRGFPVHLLTATTGCAMSERDTLAFAPEPPVTMLPIPR